MAQNEIVRQTNYTRVAMMKSTLCIISRGELAELSMCVVIFV